MSTLAEIKQYLLGYIHPDWKMKLGPFIYSGEFDKILEFLMKDENRRVTPNVKTWFRAFHETPFGESRVIMVAQEPYPKHGVADGLPFSCSKSTEPQPSLQLIHEAVKRTVYPEDEWDFPLDLTRWAKQGVLMLNMSLTAKVGVTGAHKDIWRPFIEWVIGSLNLDSCGCIFVLMGVEARSLAPSIYNMSHYVLQYEHPVAAYYSKEKRAWRCGDLFTQVNTLIEQNYGKRFVIKW